MKNQSQANYANISLISTGLTILFATVTHAYKFGHPAIVVGTVILFLFYFLNYAFQRWGNKFVLLVYSLLNLWIIIGFGLVNGFWNHTVKVSLFYLHNGLLPPFLAQMFSDPRIGNSTLETAGILTFAASMFAAYYCYELIKNRKQYYSIRDNKTGEKYND